MFDGKDTVLVIGAHPDDEVLGVGGTMAKHVAAGDDVHTLIVTEGTTEQYDDENIIQQKRDNARECAEHLGLTEVHFGEMPDMHLDDTEHIEINSVIETVCNQVRPDIVYTHSRREVNRDHVAVYDSTLVATRPESSVSMILSYETPSSTDFTPTTDGFEPDLFVNISSHIDEKIEAFNSYETEVRKYPHPRSAEALKAIAKARGVAGGVQAAEAFDILRMYE